MPISNGLALPNPLSNGTTADAVAVMADYNYLLSALNRALLDQGGTAGMNAQSTPIHNLANGTAANDAINLSQITNQWLPLGGGTLTGGLNGTTLSLSSTLSVTGASTLAALTASGLITGNAGFSGTTLSLSGNATVGGNASVTGTGTFSGSVTAPSFISTVATGLALGMGPNSAIRDSTNGASTMYFDVSTGGASGGGFTWRTTNSFTQIMTLGNAGSLTLLGGLSATSGSFSSTLGVTGASTLAALTASGLITGNAGFSGTTLSLSGNGTVGGNLSATGTLATTGGYLPNVQSVTSAATVTPTFSNDLVDITAQAVGLTLAAPTGTAVNGAGLVVRIKDNGTAQAITYNAIYVPTGVALPTTTIAGKVLKLGMIYNSNTTARWEVSSVVQE